MDFYVQEPPQEEQLVECKCKNLVDKETGLPCPDCKRKLTEANDLNHSETGIWCFRIFGLVLLQILGFLDRMLTGAAMAKSGVGIEANPIMRAIHMNSWAHLAGITLISTLIALGYVTWNRKDRLKMDLTFIIALAGYVIVIVSNTMNLVMG